MRFSYLPYLSYCGRRALYGVLLVFPILAVAQQEDSATELSLAPKFTTRRYQVRDGLSNEWVSDITQDEAGYLWIATQYGLNRFDGVTFKTYTYRGDTVSAPRANWTKKIFPAGPGQLWLGTLGRGVTLFDTQAERFVDAARECDWPVQRVVEDMLEDQSGRRWVASSGNLTVQAEPGRRPRALPGPRVRSLTELADGTIVGGGPEGIWELTATDTGRTQLLTGDVSDVYGIGSDTLLYFDATGLRGLTRADGPWQPLTLPREVDVRPNPYFLPLIVTAPDGNYWLTTGRDVYRFSRNLQQWERYAPREVLQGMAGNVSVHALFFDREGSFWWGTNRGLFQLRRALPFRQPLARFGESAPQTIREVVVHEDTLWLATPAGLYTWLRAGEQPPRLLDSNSYNALCLASDGYLYAAANDHRRINLHRYAPGGVGRDMTFNPDGGSEGSRCWRIVEDRRGRLWVAGWSTLLVFDPASGHLFSVPLLLDGKPLQVGIMDLMIDASDRLWVASLYQGALRADAVSAFEEGDDFRFQQFLHDRSDAHSLSHSLVLQIHQADNGTIWLATDGGLNQWLPELNGFRRFLRGQSLVDDKFMSLSSDRNGHLWMGSISHGIIHFDPFTERFTSYGREDGLSGNPMLLSSVFRDADGGQWIGGQQGLEHFYPAAIRSPVDRVSARLIWQSMTHYGRDTVITQVNPPLITSPLVPLLVTPDIHSLRFRFRAPSFVEAAGIQYAFRLEDFHDDWLPPTSTGELTLSNLPAGAYTLRAFATSEAGAWRVEHRPIHLRIIPPWYASQLAYAAYLLILLGLLYAFYRLQLRRRIAELHSAQLERSSTEKMAWFNRIAHEFTTPLSVITGAADRARTRVRGKMEEELNLIDGQARHLARQVAQILELARLRSGGPREEKTRADFIAYHAYLLGAYRLLAEEKGLELTFLPPRQSLLFPFAEDSWRKITGNLLANAIKFTPPGGRVTLELRIDELTGPPAVEVRVTDTGPGMSEAFQAELFTPFHREDHQRAGTGLGLSLAQELLQRMGGQLRVVSQPGRGACFIARLPYPSPAPASAPVSPASPADSSTGGSEPDRPSILVAEDHPELFDYLRFCLAESYVVTTVTDGQSALDRCRADVPDLVLSDVMMPGLNGTELTRRLAGDPVTDHIPVVLLTAKTGQEARLQGITAGAEAYLTKPFQRRELLAVLSGILGKRERLKRKYGSGDFRVETATKTQDKFVAKVVGIIKERLEDEEFSVAELATKLFVSRTQLFRKLKALTGKTPTLFIRQIRLERARRAVVESSDTFAEIAFAHGFRDPAYFSRAYREEFGQSPSETRAGAGRAT